MLSLARQEIRFATARAATKMPWITAQRHVLWAWAKTAPWKAPMTPCWTTTKPIAIRYANHSS
jgi:hypothetical protein